MTEQAATETFVVYGQYYWGKGSTLAEAKKNLQKQGGRLSDGYTILTFDADTEFEGVDGLGRFYYHSRSGEKVAHEPTEKIVKGRFHRPDGRGTNRKVTS